MDAQLIHSSNQAGCGRCHWQSVGRSLTCITFIALLVIGSVGLSYLHLGIPPAACYACFAGAVMIPCMAWYCPSIRTRPNQAAMTVQAMGAALPQPTTLRAALREHLTAAQDDWNEAVANLLRAGTIVRAGRGENPSCHDRLFLSVGRATIELHDEQVDELSDPTEQCHPVAVARQLKRWFFRPDPTALPEFGAIVAQMRRRFEREMGPLAMDQMIYNQITTQIRAERMDPLDPASLERFSEDIALLDCVSRKVAIGLLSQCGVRGNSLIFNGEGGRQLVLDFSGGASNQLMQYDCARGRVTNQPLLAAQALATLNPYQLRVLLTLCNADDFDQRVRQFLGANPELGEHLDKVASLLRDQFMGPYLQQAARSPRRGVIHEKRNALDGHFSTNMLIGISGYFGLHCCQRAILAAMSQVEALRWGVFDRQRISNLRSAVRRFCIQNQALFPLGTGVQNIINDTEYMSNEATLIALAALLDRPIHFFDLNTANYYMDENGRIMPDQIFNHQGAGSPIYLSLSGGHFDSHTPRSRFC